MCLENGRKIVHRSVFFSCKSVELQTMLQFYQQKYTANLLIFVRCMKVFMKTLKYSSANTRFPLLTMKVMAKSHKYLKINQARIYSLEI